MAFLDNSGDIILDAVLTDTGRMRLAKGDGTFKIVKFALGDDEIDYGLFNKTDERGSAYYDLEIMQTPVLEAFTNNTSVLKHKLLSMPQTNLLYLPVVKLDDETNEAAVFSTSTAATITSTKGNDSLGTYFLAADEETSEALKSTTGLLNTAGNGGTLTYIKAVQGLDTTEISFKKDIGSDLRESQYIVQVDNRLASVTLYNNLVNKATVSYIDDDQIASYYFSQTGDGEYVTRLTPPSTKNIIIDGPLGSEINFNLVASDEIESSTYLFATLGGGEGSLMTISGSSVEYYYIDTNVRITGATTGSSIDIPVRVMKKK